MSLKTRLAKLEDKSGSDTSTIILMGPDETKEQAIDSWCLRNAGKSRPENIMFIRLVAMKPVFDEDGSIVPPETAKHE